MQLYCESGDIEGAIAEFVRAMYPPTPTTPEEREIAILKARIARTRPHSQQRTILQSDLTRLRTKQLGLEVVK